MEEDFVSWIRKRLEETGLSYNEIARKSGLGVATISMVANGQKTPGLKFAKGISKIINVPAEEILRRAGRLAEISIEKMLETDLSLRQILEISRQLTPGQRQEILDMIRVYASYRNVNKDK